MRNVSQSFGGTKPRMGREARGALIIRVKDIQDPGVEFMTTWTTYVRYVGGFPWCWYQGQPYGFARTVTL